MYNKMFVINQRYCLAQKEGRYEHFFYNLYSDLNFENNLYLF